MLKIVPLKRSYGKMSSTCTRLFFFLACVLIALSGTPWKGRDTGFVLAHATEGSLGDEHGHHHHDHEAHDHHHHGHEAHGHHHDGHEAHDHHHHDHEAHVHHRHGHEAHDHHHHGHEAHDHHHHDHEAHDHHQHTHTKEIDPRTEREVWIQSFAGTALITLGGNAAILVFVVMDISKSFLNVMVAFAVGGLLGDVFLHLIPHALEAQENASGGHHHHHHDHGVHEHEHDLTVGLSLLAGIVVFFMVEKLLQGAHGNEGHGHSHGHQTTAAKKKKDDDYSEPGSKKKNAEGLRKRPGKGDTGKSEKSPQAVNVSDATTKTGIVSGTSPKAILHIVADAVHNFTDGMAIAAAFQVSYSVGQTMTIAVLFHEIPHEFGDFAVLISQGFSKRGAFGAQFVSAVGAFLGCLFGLAISSEQPAAILSFTGGGFIYIALANIVPDLMVESDNGIRQTVAELSAILVGIGMMVLIAKYEPHM